MRIKLVNTPRAVNDLREIRDYIARRSPQDAARFLDKPLNKMDPLEDCPEGFPLAPETDVAPFELRQLVVPPYRLLFRVRGPEVQILHVRHGARRRASPSDIEP